MLNRYNSQCEGCHGFVVIEADGYIGEIENVWCQNCGWEGEFMYEEEPQIDNEREAFIQGCLNENLLRTMDLDSLKLDDFQKQILQFMITLFNEGDKEYKQPMASSIYTYMKTWGCKV